MVDVHVPYMVRLLDQDYEFDNSNQLFKMVLGILFSVPSEEWPAVVAILNVKEFAEEYIGIGVDGIFFDTNNPGSMLRKLFYNFLEREKL